MKENMERENLLLNKEARNKLINKITNEEDMIKLLEEFALENDRKFEMILPGYMTWKNYAALFGLSDKGARWYVIQIVNLKMSLSKME